MREVIFLELRPRQKIVYHTPCVTSSCAVRPYSMTKFQLADKVFVYQGPVLYEAKIVKVYCAQTQKTQDQKLPNTPNKKLPKTMADQDAYFVHYLGWNVKWDEWVPVERILAIDNDSSMLKQRLEEENMREKEQPKKKKLKKEQQQSQEQDHEQNKENKDLKNANSEGKPKSAHRKSSNSSSYKGFTVKEIEMLVPDEIKVSLVDDWENLTKDHQLVELPAQTTVSEVLSLFASYCTTLYEEDTKELDITLEIIESIKLYFNKAIGTYLLYRFEKMQYSEMIEIQSQRKCEMSDLYSSIFLIRLMAILPNLMTKNEMGISSIRKVKQVLELFWKWLHKNPELFNDVSYESQTPDIALLHT